MFPEDHDEHWMAQSKNCAACLIDYDAVIRLEHHNEDKVSLARVNTITSIFHQLFFLLKYFQEYVVKRSGIGKHVKIVYEHATIGGKTESVRREFYSKIPCPLLQRLYEIYKMDFEMFGYSAEPFFNMCADD